jgi:hypothetical protein
MSPRRGGGSSSSGGGDTGGGGSDGGSSGNVYDPCASRPEWCLLKGISHNTTSEEYHPLGDHPLYDHPNNIRIAAFGIECFCLLAILVIIGWSSCRRKKRGGRSESALSSFLFHAAAISLFM